MTFVRSCVHLDERAARLAGFLGGNAHQMAFHGLCKRGRHIARTRQHLVKRINDRAVAAAMADASLDQIADLVERTPYIIAKIKDIFVSDDKKALDEEF